jgi:MFS family permease
VGNNLWHPAAISDLSERYPARRGFALSIHALGANLGDLLGPLVVGFLLVSFAYNQVFMGNLIPGLVVAGLFFIWLRGAAPAADAQHQTLSLRQYWNGVVSLTRNSGVMLLSLVGGLRAMTDNGLRTFIPFYLAGLGMGPAMVGTYLAVVQGAGLVASPLSGLLSDRIGRKPLVAGGMLATTIVVIIFANLSFIQIPGVDFGWIFVGALSLLGFFLYAMRPALQAWTMDMVPKEMGGTTVGLMFGSQSLFAAGAPLIGGILADAFGLMAAFYFVAATILAANIIVMAVPDRLLTRATAPEPAVAAPVSAPA